MSSIACRARRLGARALVADVLRSNQAMKELARKLRFAMTGVPADARLVRIVKDISGAQASAPCDELMAFAAAIAA
jgi:spore maturation protein SpmB